MKFIKVFGVVAALLATCPGAANGQSQPYSFATVAGPFASPYGVALDASGNLFVTGSGDLTIRKLTSVGSNWVSRVIAGGGYGSRDGTNRTVQFKRPFGVAVDSIGNVYVADFYNANIRKLTPVGTNWVSSTIAGLAGSGGSADGTNSDARFSLPNGVALDSAGNVYVADLGNDNIRKLTPVGTNWVSSTIAGRLWYAAGVAVDSAGNIYVAQIDYAGNGSGRVCKLTLVGTNWVSSTLAAGASPNGLALDSSGNVYVADYGNGTISRFTPEGTNWVSRVIAGRLPGSESTSVAVDSAGNVYVADYGNGTIRKGVPLAVAPSPPVFQTVMQTNGLIAFTWSASAGLTYQLQYKSDLSSTNWNSPYIPILATEATMSANYGLGPDLQRFYRLVLP